MESALALYSRILAGNRAGNSRFRREIAVDNGALKIAENKKSKSATMAKRKFSGNSAIKLSEILIQVQT